MQDKIEAVLSEAFDIPMIQFVHGMVRNDLLEYYCFSLIQMVRADNEPDRYQGLKSQARGYTDEFVNYKVGSCPNPDALQDAQFKVNVMATRLSDNREMVISNIFWVAHKQLLIRDFGDMYDSLSSECTGITSEAEEYQKNQHG